MNITNEELRTASEIIKDKFGLSFFPERRSDLQDGLQRSMRELSIPSVDELIASLPIICSDEQRHTVLINNLTNTETYFFREDPIFERFSDLIQFRIRQNRSSSKVLKIWSAGCSSGEEVYSIAILIDQLVPDKKDWDILILGTDINREMLEKARRGIYRKFSFRGVSQEIVTSNFEKASAHTFEIRSHLKNYAQFEYLNLTEPIPPSLVFKMQDIDFIFCRNVLMYFDVTTSKNIINRFYRTLRHGGVIFLGLTELANQTDKRFKTINDKGIIYFQKPSSFDMPADGKLREPGSPRAVHLPQYPEKNQSSASVSVNPIKTRVNDRRRGING
jgi:chemotaxis protein methyltransferase CheR